MAILPLESIPPGAGRSETHGHATFGIDGVWRKWPMPLLLPRFIGNRVLTALSILGIVAVLPEAGHGAITRKMTRAGVLDKGTTYPIVPVA